LRGKVGDQLGKAGWWRTYADNRGKAHQGELGELVRMLRTNFGELGLIAARQLEAMRATFPALGTDEVDQALARAGLRTADPTELPTASGIQDTLYRRLSSLLANAAVSGVAELLHGDLTSFHILQGFRAEPDTGDGLTAD